MKIIIDLQLFSQEKTEKATPKRRKEAREKGQVLQSKEINTALIILSAILVLKLFSSAMSREIGNFTLKTFETYLLAEDLISVSGLQKLSFEIMVILAKILSPLFITVIIVGIGISYAQVGTLFTTKTLKFNLNKINPLEGFKRLFSKKALVELLKSSIKIIILIYLGYSFIIGKVDEFPQLINLSPINGIKEIMSWTFTISARIAMVLILLSGFDYFYQWWDYENSLKMSKQELKEEYKQVEGNPLIKSKIKEKQRQMSLRRMMQDVPKADVIITNPTHYAIAIKYDANASQAPIVIAKGKDLIALKIREVGNEKKIPIVENKPLAQSLYKLVDVGNAIPPELYQAVAEVLAYVYNLNSI